MVSMQKGPRKRNDAGMALIAALIFITISVIVLTSMTARYVQQRINVDRFEDYYTCFDGVEAAVQQCKVALETGGSGIIGLEDWEPQFSDDGRLLLPGFDDVGVTSTTFATMPGVEFMAYTIDWFGNGRDMNGDGMADSLAEMGMYSVHAAARTGGMVRQVEVVYDSHDVNVWRNAIFAGSGQAGRLINGNVSIHGSVHLLGDHLPEGGLAIVGVEDPAVELSGASLISNNYVGMPDDLRQRIPTLPLRDYQGDEVQTLNANLRVKRGIVSMNGNARIGLNQNAGDTVKNPMDGTFITDGWGGNSVINDGGRGIPTRVWSDNGFDTFYDLGDRVSFPMLDDDWRDMDGTRVMNPNTGVWYTHEEYFSEVLLADPDIRTDGVYDGSITINARSSPDYYWNATTQEELTGAAAAAATPDPTDDFIRYNAGNKVLTMNGQIRINGDLTFTGQGNQRTIHYSGRAALLVDGNVDIDANLITCNNGNPGNVADSFPVHNIMGIMATQDMMVGASAQLSIMGAFYAQGTIQTQKQSNILGTFVANYFDMGTNVPSIFQVPALADNLPYGMIGNFPIVVLQQAAWREMGIV